MKLSHKLYAVLNFLVLTVVIWWNYYSNTGNIGGKTVGELSAEYDNYFTPAGYAFAIWGIIYLALVIQSIYFLKAAFGKSMDSDFLSQMGPYLIMANIFNAGWIWFWLMEHTGLSVVVMLGILFCLVILILNLKMNTTKVSTANKWFVRTPISIYSGWIAVATIANISAYLAKLGWTGGPFSEITWTIIMIAVAAILNVLILFNRKLIAFPLVGAWALMAISVRHAGSENLLQGSALIGLSCIFLALGIHLLRTNVIMARK